MDLIPKTSKNQIGGGFEKVAGAGSQGLFSVFSRISFFKITMLAAGLLLVISLASWAGLKIYTAADIKEIEKIKAEETTVFGQTDQELASFIIGTEKSAQALQGLLKSHIYASEIFEKLGKATLLRVQWESCDIEIETQMVSLRGRAADYSILAQQYLALKQAGFKNLKISGIALNKLGGVTFGLNLEFEPEIIHK